MSLLRVFMPPVRVPVAIITNLLVLGISLHCTVVILPSCYGARAFNSRKSIHQRCCPGSLRGTWVARVFKSRKSMQNRCCPGPNVGTRGAGTIGGGGEGSAMPASTSSSHLCCSVSRGIGRDRSAGISLGFLGLKVKFSFQGWKSFSSPRLRY